MNRCRTCKHFDTNTYQYSSGVGICDSPKIWRGYRVTIQGDSPKIWRGYRVTIQEILPDGALVEDDETWGFIVAPDFGCVHHETADTPEEVE
jgi:hypothetical protein